MISCKYGGYLGDCFFFLQDGWGADELVEVKSVGVVEVDKLCGSARMSGPSGKPVTIRGCHHELTCVCIFT